MGKLRIDIKTVAIMVAINVLANLVVGWFLGYCIEISGLYDLEYFKVLEHEKGKIIYAVGYEIGHLIGYVLVNFLVYLLYKPNKKEFLSETKGLLTKKDGLIWHIQKYKGTEIAILCIQAIIFLVMQFLCSEHSAFAIIYRILGIPLGFVVSILIMGALQISHIVSAQYYWRIRHYMGI